MYMYIYMIIHITYVYDIYAQKSLMGGSAAKQKHHIYINPLFFVFFVLLPSLATKNPKKRPADES